MARAAATAELDAIARLAAAVLEAPIATVSAFDDDAVVRVGARGVSWPPADEAALVRRLAEREVAEPITLELAAIADASKLTAEGARSVCALPVRDGETTLGLLAVYATSELAPSPAAQRRMIDLAEVTSRILRARLEAQAVAAAGRAAGFASALCELLRAADWRASLKIAIAALSVDRAVHWVVRGMMIEHAGAWDRTGRFTPPDITASPVPGLVRALSQDDVIASPEVRADARLAELSAYYEAGGVAAQLFAAIRYRDRIIAALAFEHGEPRRWTGDEVQFCASIAGWLGPLLALADGRNLELTEHHVLELVERAPERVIIGDRDGRVVYVNASAARMWGARDDAIGRFVGELNPAELKSMPGLERLRRTGHDPNIARPMVRRFEPPGEPARLMEVSTTPYTLNGTPYLGWIARDVGPTERRLEATMESVATAVGHVSLDGQFLRFNAQLPRLLGRTGGELRPFIQSLDVPPPPEQPGLSFVDAFGVAGTLELGVLRAALAASSGPHVLDHQLVRPDGTQRWIELAIALAREADGQPAYFVVTATDRTAQHRTRAALRELADVLALSGSELYARVCSFLATTLCARHVHIARLRDQVREPIATWRDGQRVIDHSSAITGALCEYTVRSGLCYHPERIQAVFPDDPLLAELGAHSYLGVPVLDHRGAAIGIIAIVGDRPFDAVVNIEDLARVCAARVAAVMLSGDAIAAIEQREEQLRQITESAVETFWLAQWPSRELLYVSPAFEALTGRTIASVYADRRTWGVGLHPDDRARVDAAMKLLETSQVNETARVIRADGQLRWIQIRAAVIRDRDGRPYRVAGAFEDITQGKLAQLALEDRERELAEALASSEREVAALQGQLGEQEVHGMIGSSQAMRTVFRRLRQAAQSDVTVLLAGESGTGKELAAKALHAMSSRRSRPFVAINCAAIPEPLLESELFGHVKGAFTGASRDKLGLMQAADSGTLFLDEIGDMSPVLQVKLLRALQERQIRRVGDERPLAVDVRMISASHRDLRVLVAGGRMREDFYYRIKVFEIVMPALHDRREDIPSLANHFVAELGRAAGKPHVALAADALRALLHHRWPGNVRELRNAIEHALVTVTGSAIQLHHLPPEVRGAELRPPVPVDSVATPRVGTRLVATPASQRERIEDALRRSGGNRAEAARLLGIGRVTLWKRMRRLAMISGEPTGADDAPGGDDLPESPDEP